MNLLALAIPTLLLLAAGQPEFGIVAACLGTAAIFLGRLSNSRIRSAERAEILDSTQRDDLTGLANRRLFLARLRSCLASPLSKDANTAVFFIDLDNFKTINDTLGHTSGDRVLIEVANHLVGAVSPQALFARMGGDEFTLLIEEVESREDVVAIANDIMETFAKPLQVRGEEIWVNASVGIVMAPMPRPTLDDFLAMADTALYHAKSLGKGQFTLFEPHLPRPTRRLISLDADLQDAVKKDEIILHFQPIFELASMKIAGFEALVRWKHPRYGILSPGEFIPLAEESGFIRALGSWIIENGCEQLSVWQSLSGTPLTLSINLSVLQFRQKDLLTHLTETSARLGLPSRSVILEITESVLMQNGLGTQQILRGLRDLGFGIAVDDFGVGYSSLGYLKDFEVDLLKLDRSFLTDVSSAKARALVRGAIELGKNLEVLVVAEGIETPDQFNLLRDAGCDLGQGYLLGRPVEAVKVTELLSMGGLGSQVAVSLQDTLLSSNQA